MLHEMIKYMCCQSCTSLPANVRNCCYICRHNGEYVQTEGLIEDVMADKLVAYLDKQSKTDKPFFVYYATRSIHV